MESSRAKLTVDDYLAMPEGPPWAQLIQGELVQDASPDLDHQVVLGSLYLRLAADVNQRSLGLALMAPMDVILSDTDVFQPDLLFISTERQDRLWRRGVRGAPDLVIEILSPSTARRDLGYKCSAYGKAGVREAWFVDLDQRTMTIYRFGDEGDHTVRIAAGNDCFSSAVLPGFTLNLQTIFGGIRDWHQWLTQSHPLGA